MSRKRRHHDEDHENHERWLVSYADFITLLFAFFVVMYSVSRVDTKRLIQASNAIKWALHYQGTGGVGALPLFEGPPSEGGCVVNLSTGRPGTPDHRAVEAVRQRIEARLKPILVTRIPASAVQVQADTRRLTIRLAATHFFDAGQAALRPEALPVVDAIADELKPLGRPVRIEGHTDETQLQSARFRDNWDLSAARAARVTSYLADAHAFKPDLLSAVGYGSSRPLAPAGAPGADETNRRVELAVEFVAGDPLDVVTR
ncbi:MAG TPA: flagellar motor protein MotB [Myxococcaceae bacterium]|nr:flagellar motor protein MotB [Myxococcaceae bacterium]